MSDPSASRRMLASQASGGPGGHSFVRRTFSLEFTQTAQCPTCAREPEALLFSTNLYYIPASAVAENREDVPFGSLLRRASPLTSLPAARSLCARLRICACARCVHLCACGCVWACMLQAVDVYGGGQVYIFLKFYYYFFGVPKFCCFFLELLNIPFSSAPQGVALPGGCARRSTRAVTRRAAGPPPDQWRRRPPRCRRCWCWASCGAAPTCPRARRGGPSPHDLWPPQWDDVGNGMPAEKGNPTWPFHNGTLSRLDPNGWAGRWKKIGHAVWHAFPKIALSASPSLLPTHQS